MHLSGLSQRAHVAAGRHAAQVACGPCSAPIARHAPQSSSGMTAPAPRRLASPRIGTVRRVAAKELPKMTDQQYSKLRIGDKLPEEYANYMPNDKGKRRAGIILHPTSLPGNYGIGELGSEARAFVDWLFAAGMQLWQMLPVGPPDPMYWSPYSGTDANCGWPLLISIDELIAEGLVDEKDAPPKVPIADVDYPKVMAAKTPVLKFAAGRLLGDSKFTELKKQMENFRKSNPWIEESAVFDVARNLPELSQSAWWDWPEDLRFRKGDAMRKFKEQHKVAIDEFIAIQFLFDRQWQALKAYANGKGIKIVGDMPIYVGGHSADVWSNQGLFELDPKTGVPALVSGVPPDAFSETGQLWGSPLYKWSAHKNERYAWWCQRMGRALKLYDETRIDHFRGFAGYWSVDGKAETAMGGHWVKGPGVELFDAMKAKLGSVPILAEDLGVITTDVVQLREAIGAPGMVVLQFAWGGGPANVHLPHQHYPNCFCYSGTHDNETTVGWWQNTQEGDREYLKFYLKTDGNDIAWVMINAAMQSVANSAVLVMQDVMRLDNSARMNTPGKAAGNWGWRMGDSGVFERLANEAVALRRLAGLANRLAPGAEFTA